MLHPHLHPATAATAEPKCFEPCEQHLFEYLPTKGRFQVLVSILWLQISVQVPSF